MYETKPTNIQTNFSANKDRFVIDRDYVLLEGAGLKVFKDHINDTALVAQHTYTSGHSGEPIVTVKF